MICVLDLVSILKKMALLSNTQIALNDSTLLEEHFVTFWTKSARHTGEFYRISPLLFMVFQ